MLILSVYIFIYLVATVFLSILFFLLPLPFRCITAFREVVHFFVRFSVKIRLFPSQQKNKKVLKPLRFQDFFMVETKRIELSTLRMRTVRSPS